MKKITKIKKEIGFNPKTTTIKLHKSNKKTKNNEKRRFSEFIKQSYQKNKKIRIKQKNLKTMSSKIALGFSEPKYTDFYPRINQKTKTITITPINKEKNPEFDSILTILTPEEAMKITQKHFKATKKPINSYCKSEGSSLSTELVAYPIIEKKLNFSFLCGGARKEANYRENELGIGLPKETIKKITKDLN